MVCPQASLVLVMTLTIVVVSGGMGLEGDGPAGGMWVPESGPSTPGDEAPRLDVLFCLDTTGSMYDEIQVAKDEILDIAAVVSSGTPEPDVRYALVVYRDLGEVYVTKAFDFMSAKELAKVLSRVKAYGGNDYEESVAEALHRSVHDVSWDPEANGAIYLIGDAPPHTDYDNGYDYRIAAMDAAERGIVINAIGCSGIRGNEAEFMEMAELTGGVFVYLSYGVAREEVVCRGYDAGPDDPEGTEDCSGALSSESYYTCDGVGGSHGNDLDVVLCSMIKDQASQTGVEYDD